MVEVIPKQEKDKLWIKSNSVERLVAIFINSCPEVFCKKAVLKNCRPQPLTIIKKRFCHRCFHVNFAKFLKTLFL